MDKPSEVEFNSSFENICDAYRHADGSITYVVYDMSPSDTPSPRDDEGNVATLINTNGDYNAIDTDTAGLQEAHERWNGRVGRGNRTDLMDRYLSIFRPDIVHYVEFWSAYTSQSGGAHGWGYVTKKDWDAAEFADHVEPSKIFDAEVDLYRQWAGGEIYGACHVTVGAPIVIYGEHGAYIDGYETNEDWCWGFLGYSDHKDITEQFTDSTITEVLA